MITIIDINPIRPTDKHAVSARVKLSGIHQIRLVTRVGVNKRPIERVKEQTFNQLACIVDESLSSYLAISQH